YRFSADVRHDDSLGPSRVGLYFGRRRHAGGEGEGHSYFALWFADRGTLSTKGRNGEALGRGMLEGFYLERRAAPGEFNPHAQMSGLLTFRPIAPPLGPAPWRRLAVEVTTGHVKALWQGPDGAWQTVCDRDAEDVARMMQAHLGSLDPRLAGGPSGP